METPIIESAVGQPASWLRPAVRHYVGYREEGVLPALHRGLPSPYLTVVVTWGRPTVLDRLPDASATPRAFGALVGGLHRTPVHIRHEGHQEGIQLAIEPLAARELLGLPAGELAGAVIDLDELAGPLAGELCDRLSAAAGWPARFSVLDDVLGRLMAVRARPREVAAEVARAWRRLRASQGNLSIAELAAEVGWSRRHLSERFRLEVGLSPKVAARVVRFDRARRRLGSAEAPSLAQVAATGGFADQAHLTREWRELAGCSPTTWLAEELPSVQDLPDELA